MKVDLRSQLGSWIMQMKRFITPAINQRRMSLPVPRLTLNVNNCCSEWPCHVQNLKSQCAVKKKRKGGRCLRELCVNGLKGKES